MNGLVRKFQFPNKSNIGGSPDRGAVTLILSNGYFILRTGRLKDHAGW